MTTLLSWETDTYRFVKNWSCNECTNDCRCLTGKFRIEVFMPTYQHGGLISQAISSVLTQSIAQEDLSLLIHDDGSTDSTVDEALAELGGAKTPFTLMARKENSFSRERFLFFFECIQLSRATYLAFLDGDDFWTDPQKLEKQLEMLDSDPSAVICHSGYEVRDGKASTVQPDPSFSLNQLESTKLLLRENFIGTLTAVIRVAAIKLDWTLEEIKRLAIGDYPVWLSLVQKNNSRILFLPEKTAVYRIHGRNYWATKSIFQQMQRTRQIQSTLSSLFKAKVGEPTAVFVCRVLFRRTARKAMSYFRISRGWLSRFSLEP